MAAVTGTFGATVEQHSQGSRTVNSATVRLTETSTPCEYVWICAPTANHTLGANTGHILIGTSSGTNVSGGGGLTNDRFEGIAYPIHDASLIYLTGFNSGDGVEYQIFKKA